MSHPRQNVELLIGCLPLAQLRALRCTGLIALAHTRGTLTHPLSDPTSNPEHIILVQTTQGYPLFTLQTALFCAHSMNHRTRMDIALKPLTAIADAYDEGTLEIPNALFLCEDTDGTPLMTLEDAFRARRTAHQQF
jgi:hypothetical protein